jgi:formylglycine-generating enzyme required for sulfatase activity
VDWYDAIDYCNKRSIKEGLTPAYIIEGAGTYNVSVKWDKSANGYRLPTEAEWEYACRAGTTTPFNTGFNITTNQANYKGDEPYNNYAKGESRNKIIDAGAFPANSWGLFDMHGNIAEWCWDWYGPYPEEAQTNPQGAESGTQRVLRGGTARSPGKDIRSASRAQEAPERTLYSYGGFRVARSAEPEKSAPITAAAAAEPSKIFANMVSIRGGSFAMGSPSNDPSRLRDEAQRNVLVSSFYMAKIPVTQKEYEEIMGTNPSRDKNNDMPVEYVKWEDAITYCIRLSEKEGLKSAYTINRYNPTQSAYTAVTTVVWHRNADGYRLPTEAEWEYACRAGSTTRYHTGNDILHTMASFNRRAPTVPASFPPNAWGLYDMHGNQWEWCWDWYGEYSKDDLVNPTGASYGSKRVLRGGGYSSPPLELRSAYREGMEPQYRERNSFRLVRSNFSNEE